MSDIHRLTTITFVDVVTPRRVRRDKVQSAVFYTCECGWWTSAATGGTVQRDEMREHIEDKAREREREIHHSDWNAWADLLRSHESRNRRLSEARRLIAEAPSE